MIAEYTTPDEVRAVLGVDVTDIEDSTLGLTVYENYLTMELEEVSLTLPATFTSTAAIASPSDTELRFLNSAKLFATFALAKQLSGSLPLFALKQETDGKAQATRFDNPYKDVISSVKKEYDRAKTKLMQAFTALGSSSASVTARVYFTKVGLGTDPITNV